MFKVFYNGTLIDICISKIEVGVKYDNEDDLLIQEFCDICETNKVANNSSICEECGKGIHVDLLA